MSSKHFHIERKRAVTEVYRGLKRLREEEGEIVHSPIRIAAIAAEGASRQQIYNWLKEDLTDEGLANKISRKGAKPAPTDDQELLLLGFTISCRLSLDPVTLSSLSDFCKSYLNVEVSESTLSRIMTRHGFSNQKVLGRNSRMVNEQVVDDAIAAIADIRSYSFPPE
jgi:transposase